MAVCYATMKNSHGTFTYKLEREGYSLLDFDKEFKEIAKNRGWRNQGLIGGALAPLITNKGKGIEHENHHC